MLEILFEMVIEIVGELIIEGSFEIVNNKKIPLPYRIIAGIVVFIVVATITSVLCYVLITIVAAFYNNNHKILATLCATTFIFLVAYVINYFLKKLDNVDERKDA